MNEFNQIYSIGSLTTLGPMRPVPLLSRWQWVLSPPLQPSQRLWAPPMVSTTPPTDTQPLALDQVDMELVMVQVDMDQVDMDLDMAVLVVCMAPTWEHCSLMVSFVKVSKINL